SRKNPLNALPWTLKALETVPEDDKNFEIYKFSALNFIQYVPQLVINTTDNFRDKVFIEGNKKLTVRSPETRKQTQYDQYQYRYAESLNGKRVFWSIDSTREI